MKTQRPLISPIIAIVALLCTISYAQGVGQVEHNLSDCAEDPEWSANRNAAEDLVIAGAWLGIEEFPDKSLKPTVQNYYDAYIHSDVSAMLNLMIGLSQEHLEVEQHHIEDRLSSQPFFRYTVHSVLPDHSNPGHAQVYVTVVIRTQSGQCAEGGVMRDWILLDGNWLTFPTGRQGLHASLGTRARANEWYRPAAMAPKAERVEK